MRKTLLALFVVAIMASALFAEETAKDFNGLFARWNSSLASGDPGKVADNYATDAILVPTVSNKVRHSREEIADYFEHFLQLKPKGELQESNIRVYGEIAINSGVYDFHIVKDGKESVVKARFTFVYKLGGDGNWLIIEHHSSAMPETGK